jgi:hypothetical protein
MRQAIFESVSVIACLNNMAMVGQPIKQHGGHFGIAKHSNKTIVYIFQKNQGS